MAIDSSILFGPYLFIINSIHNLATRCFSIRPKLKQVVNLYAASGKHRRCQSAQVCG